MSEEVYSPLSRFRIALARFDEENSRDPHRFEHGGISYPQELFLARRLSEWVLRLEPQASEILQLAARCQHLCRWVIPRNSFPMTRAGYLKWRQELKEFHAHRAGEILRDVGYSEEVVTAVQALNLKKNFPRDPESQILEDALCLVFLENQYDDFVKKTEPEKVISILQKTWKKMSPRGHAEALKLNFSPQGQALIQTALKR